MGVADLGQHFALEELVAAEVDGVRRSGAQHHYGHAADRSKYSLVSYHPQEGLADALAPRRVQRLHPRLCKILNQ